MAYEAEGRRIAAQLSEQFGRLLEARLAQPIVLVFERGSWTVPPNFIFKFGYAGTGPDSFHAFLEASGFELAKDRIEAGQPGDVLRAPGYAPVDPVAQAAKAVEMLREKARLENERAVTMMDHGLLREALQILEGVRTMVADQPQPMNLLNIAVCHARLGEFDEGLQILDDAIGRWPENERLRANYEAIKQDAPKFAPEPYPAMAPTPISTPSPVAAAPVSRPPSTPPPPSPPPFEEPKPVVAAPVPPPKVPTSAIPIPAPEMPALPTAVLTPAPAIQTPPAKIPTPPPAMPAAPSVASSATPPSVVGYSRDAETQVLSQAWPPSQADISTTRPQTGPEPILGTPVPPPPVVPRPTPQTASTVPPPVVARPPVAPPPLAAPPIAKGAPPKSAAKPPVKGAPKKNNALIIGGVAAIAAVALIVIGYTGWQIFMRPSDPGTADAPPAAVEPVAQPAATPPADPVPATTPAATTPAPIPETPAPPAPDNTARTPDVPASPSSRTGRAATQPDVLLRARRMIDSGQFAEATTLLTEEQRKNPNNADIARLLAQAREGGARGAAPAPAPGGGAAGAKQAFDQGTAAEASGDLPAALQNFQRARRLDQALPGVQDAINRVSGRMNAEGHDALVRARQYDALDRPEQAVQWYERAVRMLPEDSPDRRVARERLDRSVERDKRLDVLRRAR